jgi:hypothetical protein
MQLLSGRVLGGLLVRRRSHGRNHKVIANHLEVCAAMVLSSVNQGA